jgi:hypothetical protein
MRADDAENLGVSDQFNEMAFGADHIKIKRTPQMFTESDAE